MTPETPPADCLICRKHRGEFLIPGGAIYTDHLVYASHAHIAEGENTAYLGWLVVETQRHIPGLADLNDKEGESLGRIVARLSRALKTTQGAEHVYAFAIGHGVPHLHLHLLPRYPGTPREFWGLRLDEWPLARRGDWGCIAELVEQIRDLLEHEA